VTSVSHESRVTGVNLVTLQSFKLKTSPNVFEVRRKLTGCVLPLISNEISDARHTERRTSSTNWKALVSISLKDCNQSINQSINQSVSQSVSQSVNQSIIQSMTLFKYQNI